MGKYKRVLSSIDMGTSRIRVAIGETDDSTGGIRVIGYADKDSEGSVCKGEISDMEKAKGILDDAIRESERMADREIDPLSIFVGITGAHIGGVDVAGSILIDSEDRKITTRHIGEALKIAKGSPLSGDCSPLNSIDGCFVLDGTRHVNDPLGQTANKLEARSHIIYGKRNNINNFLNPIRELGFNLPKPVFNGLASALAVLTMDDFEHGVLVVDIGAGVTEYILFHNFMAVECGALTVGCDHIANDLSLGLEINFPKAKSIVKGNTAHELKLQGQSSIEIPGSLGTRQLPIHSVEKIIEMRIRETFEVVHESLKAHNLIQLLHNGIVICGGGANLPYTKEIASAVFEAPARIGYAVDVGGPESLLKFPGNFTALGLLRHAEHELNPSSPSGLGNFINTKMWPVWKKAWKLLFDVVNF